MLGQRVSLIEIDTMQPLEEFAKDSGQTYAEQQTR
jgi:hypothetical protein